ncbi:preprotein translocase subunit YajC [Aeromicrobium sp. CF3.5]|uniref:preprotein translocase subunit YajC n=1 Tax=Aeromicrobium sp. CF3.5 TaxID=3373078 RepID=UPI003EE6C9C4
MSNDLVQFLPLVLLAILFWLLVLRPARKRQREFSGLQSQLEPGLVVMLASGIHGEIVTTGDDTIQLRIAPDVVVTVARQAVGRIIEPAGTTPESVAGPESE